MAPEDGKPDNYIVEPLERKKKESVKREKKYRIIAIDNDHALAEPFSKEFVENRIKCCPQVKSILYCFDQMNNPIHHQVIEKVISFNFNEILERWLKNLDGVHQEYSNLFGGSSINKLYLNGEEPCFIGVPFKTEMISKL